MAGRVFSTLTQFGRWGADHIGFQLNYNHRSADVNASRRVYNSRVGRPIDYPLLPSRTRNFSWDIMPRRAMVTQRTLSSSHTTLWDPIVDDVVIQEIWEAPGGLSFPWRFMLAMYEVYVQQPDWLNGEYMLWCPVDCTRKVYPVDLVNMLVDGEEFDISWRGDDQRAGVVSRNCPGGGTPGKDVWSGSTMELHWKLRSEVAPSVGVALFGGSSTPETSQFEAE